MPLIQPDLTMKTPMESQSVVAAAIAIHRLAFLFAPAVARKPAKTKTTTTFKAMLITGASAVNHISKTQALRFANRTKHGTTNANGPRNIKNSRPPEGPNGPAPLDRMPSSDQQTRPTAAPTRPRTIAIRAPNVEIQRPPKAVRWNAGLGFVCI